MSGHHPSPLRKRSISPRADKEKEKDAFSLSALAVLLAATSMCTYNVGGCTMGVRCTVVISGIVH